MSKQLEPSIQDYARFYGLACDYLEREPLHCIQIPGKDVFLAQLEDPLDGDDDSEEGPQRYDHASGDPGLDRTRSDRQSRPLRINGSQDSPKGARLGQCTFLIGRTTPEQDWTHSTTVGLTSERMLIDTATASLLASIVGATGTPSCFDELADIDTKRFQRLKQPVPLLRSDHECDVQQFLEPVIPHLGDEFLPLETLDEEADEGFTWPSKYHELPDEIWKRLITEKPEIPGHAFRILFDSVDFDASDTGKAIFDVDEEAELRYKKSCLPEPGTPPLLPLSPEVLPFVPSSDTGHLEPLSEHSSPTREEAQRLELKILAKDAIRVKTKVPESSSQISDPMLLDSDSLGDMYSPLKGIRQQLSSPPVERVPIQLLKVEIPLSPPTPVSRPHREPKITFSETLTDVVSNLPEPIPELEGDSMLEGIDAFFDETVRSAATKAEQKIEQEQLQEADTTWRVTVPLMEFSLAVAPWNTTLDEVPRNEKNKTYDKLLTELKTLHFREHAWLLGGKAERDLQWTPFPAILGKVELRESISDDGSLAQYLTQPDCLSTGNLVWISRGLRIFDELQFGNETELEEGSFPEGKDFESMMRKRKLDLDYDEEESSMLRRGCLNSLYVAKSMQKDPFSALGSLENFMNTRTGLFQTKKTEDHLIDPPTTQVAIVDDYRQLSPDQANARFESVILPAAPSPIITVSKETRQFVVSGAFLKNRKLARRIQKLFPSAQFIERGSSLNASVREFLPSRTLGQTLVPSDMMADGADIMLSPSTGLLWTTLQKIKQRSLPGQVNRSAAQDRITQTAPGFEMLIVLISEDRPPSADSHLAPSRVLDLSDCEAIAQITALCSSLKVDTQAIFVNGGTEELASWIVALMVKHGATDPSVRLIQEETLWEVFLRRAGVNAFAAQAILAKLNAECMRKSGNADFGLTAFVKMAAEERIARFESLLGGRQLLTRVNDFIDASW